LLVGVSARGYDAPGGRRRPRASSSRRLRRRRGVPRRDEGLARAAAARRPLVRPPCARRTRLLVAVPARAAPATRAAAHLGLAPDLPGTARRRRGSVVAGFAGCGRARCVSVGGRPAGL